MLVAISRLQDTLQELRAEVELVTRAEEVEKHSSAIQVVTQLTQPSHHLLHGGPREWYTRGSPANLHKFKVPENEEKHNTQQQPQ